MVELHWLFYCLLRVVGLDINYVIPHPTKSFWCKFKLHRDEHTHGLLLNLHNTQIACRTRVLIPADFGLTLFQDS